MRVAAWARGPIPRGGALVVPSRLACNLWRQLAVCIFRVARSIIASRRYAKETRMDLELKNKVAIVGGASKGLGRACAEVLAQEGAKVTVCSRSQTDLDRRAKEIRGTTG